MKILERLIVGTLLVAVIAAGMYGYRYYCDHKKPNFSQEAVIYVRPGDSPASVVDSIARKAGVLDRGSLERAFRSTGAPQPGRYVIAPSMSSTAAARKISKGWEDEMNLTIAPVFRTPEDVAELLAAQLMAPEEEIAAALKDKAVLAAYGFTPETALALVLPDTYRVKWSISVKELLDRLYQEYQKYWNQERRSRAEQQGLTPVEAAILASIVNEETKYQPEMARVAGVYLNRLHAPGWKLQADPTVAFCFQYTLKRVLNRHLEYDSPYNTYMYEGLPPGLISCAPKACLEAVLHPSTEPNFYFCASPALDGTHRFARTNAQHEANARAYRAALAKLGK